MPLGLYFFAGLKKPFVLAVTFALQVFSGSEPQGGRVDTIPETRRRGAIRKDMAQVGIAIFAPNFSSCHKETTVLLFHNMVGD